MAKYDADSIVPMLFQRWDDRFEKLNYVLSLNSAFEITTPIDAVQKEAGAKGMAVIIMVALVPTEDVYGRPDLEPGEPDDEQPQPE